MLGEPTHPIANKAATEMENHKLLDHEIRDMIASLTKRLAELQQIHKSAGSASSQGHPHNDLSHSQLHIGRQTRHDEDHGLHIITLAGSNQGATMHGELGNDESANPEDVDPYETLGTYVNSNFQAINNSIMLGGSYKTNDPGVHMDISDVIDHQHQHGHHDHQPGQKHDACEKRGKKKKDKENGKTKLQHSDQSE